MPTENENTGQHITAVVQNKHKSHPRSTDLERSVLEPHGTILRMSHFGFHVLMHIREGLNKGEEKIQVIRACQP